MARHRRDRKRSWRVLLPHDRARGDGQWVPGIAHGAITYALADSTLAFAVNAQGQHAVGVTSTIQHLAAVQVGDVLTARAIPRSDGSRIAHVDVEVQNNTASWRG